jgi:hypothetical protein
LTQTSLGGQAVAHAPQWFESELRSVQVPEQFAVFGQACVHVPSAQAAPPGQTLPTEPQLFELLRRLTQAVVGPSLPKAGAGTLLPAHCAAHAPLVQICPLGQALTQPPQWSALFWRLTHSPLQTVVPAGQPSVHCPPTQN